MQGDRARHELSAEFVCALFDQGSEVDRALGEPLLVRSAFGEVEQCIDESAKALSTREHASHARFKRLRKQRVLDHRLREANDAVDRRAKLVGGVRHEVVAELGRGFELGVLDDEFRRQNFRVAPRTSVLLGDDEGLGKHEEKLSVARDAWRRDHLALIENFEHEREAEDHETRGDDHRVHVMRRAELAAHVEQFDREESEREDLNEGQVHAPQRGDRRRKHREDEHRLSDLEEATKAERHLRSDDRIEEQLEHDRQNRNRDELDGAEHVEAVDVRCEGPHHLTLRENARGEQHREHGHEERRALAATHREEPEVVERHHCEAADEEERRAELRRECRLSDRQRGNLGARPRADRLHVLIGDVPVHVVERDPVATRGSR